MNPKNINSEIFINKIQDKNILISNFKTDNNKINKFKEFIIK